MAATGQGILGNNMFAYCQNNPVSFVDPTGLCTYVGYQPWLSPNGQYIDCGNRNCPTISRYQPSRYTSSKPKKALVSSNGVYVSANVGVFVITGTLTLAEDTKGNMQLHYSFGFDVSTSGSFLVSAGVVNNYCLAPDISTLLGDAYNIGGSYASHLPKTPLVFTRSGSFFQSGDGHIGITHMSGIALRGSQDIDINSITGAEFHGGYSYTGALTPSLNVFELIGIPIS